MAWDQDELEAMDLGELRQLCATHGIVVAKGAHRKTCVARLLKFQEAGHSRSSCSSSGSSGSPSQHEGVRVLLEATTADEAGDYTTAIELYEQGCRRLLDGMKEAQTDEHKASLQQQLMQALERAEHLKSNMGSPSKGKFTGKGKDKGKGGSDGGGGGAAAGSGGGGDDGSKSAAKSRDGKSTKAPSHDLPVKAAPKTFDGHDCGEWRTILKDLIRDPTISHHCEGLKLRQRGNGAYTLRPLPETGTQVDHIFECQAMGDVLYRVESLRPILRQVDWTAKPQSGLKHQPVVVGNALGHAKDVHNRVGFLAAIDGLVNKKKQGAFRRLLNQLAVGVTPERGLEAELAINFARGESPFEEAQAAGMAKAVAARLREMEDPFTSALRDAPLGGQNFYDPLADEVVQLYECFDLTGRV